MQAMSLILTKNFLFRPKEVPKTESTIGVQIYEIKKLKDIDLSVWDFAGQLEYATNHQVFIHCNE